MAVASLSAGPQSFPLLPTIKLGPCGTASWVGGLCTFWDPVGLSNELSCEAGSFSRCHLNPQEVFSQWFEGYFLSLGPWVAWSISLPSCSSRFICAQMWDHWVLQLPPCHESCPPQLPVSAPPTGLDECFFFISLVIELPYSWIFCQFSLFFVFKLLSFFWLCEETQCIYLRLHLGQKSSLGTLLMHK